MKINVTRIFETSRAIATKSGQELKDFIVFVAEALSQIIQALRNNLNFEDNFNAFIISPTVQDGAIQVINTNGKRPTGILWPTSSSNFNYPITSFAWQFNDAGLVQVKVGFAGSPPSGTLIQIKLVILF